MGNNIPLLTDSYKLTHHKMYPPRARYVGSYLEARKGGEMDHSLFFGLQYILKNYLEGRVVTEEDVEEAREFSAMHFDFGNDSYFNYDGWMGIVKNHEGRLPVKIKAVPEGTVVPESNVLLTVENTDPATPWIVNHIETLLVQLWYPITVATISMYQKMRLLHTLDATGDPDLVNFMLHDFGYRGSTSVESAAIGGAAHLVNFMGTDTIGAIQLLRNYYGAEMAGFSVPASEHSTITTWGQDGETDAYRHILETFDSGIVSIVSDSWDIINACENIYGGELKELIESNPYRRLVVRPDSGDPKEVVPEVLFTLSERFGYTINDKGYKVLPPYIRVIQGDGISRHSLGSLIDELSYTGWSLDNMVFGSGGGLLQDCNRDTLRFAFKASWAYVNNAYREVYKQPVTDHTKNSKRGKLALTFDGNNYRTVPEVENSGNILQQVFLNGVIPTTAITNLDEVRARANEGMEWLRDRKNVRAVGA